MTAVHTAMLLIALTQGSPWQKGIVESFNGRLRDEARLLVYRWRLHYNHRRIQRALGKLTPAVFAAACLATTLQQLSQGVDR